MALIKVSDNPELFELRLQSGDVITSFGAGGRVVGRRRVVEMWDLGEWAEHFENFVMEAVSHIHEVKASAEIEREKVLWAAREESQERIAWYYHDDTKARRSASPLTNQPMDTPTMKRLAELEWIIAQCQLAMKRLFPIHQYAYGNPDWMQGDGTLHEPECKIYLQEFERWLAACPNEAELFAAQGYTMARMRKYFDSTCTPPD